MKTDFNARPIYLQREERIKAHFLICFLSQDIYRQLESILENKYTVNQIIETLKGMQVTALDRYGYIPTYKRTELTNKLHDTFWFHTDTQIIKKVKMRSFADSVKLW